MAKRRSILVPIVVIGRLRVKIIIKLRQDEGRPPIWPALT